MRMAFAVGTGLLTLALARGAEAQDERSLTLSEVVTAARTRAADAKEARANAEGANAAIDAAYAGYLPSLRAQADGDRAWSHSYQPNPENGTLRGTPTASWNSNV